MFSYINNTEQNVIEGLVLDYIEIIVAGAVVMTFFWWLLRNSLSLKTVSVYNLATALSLHLAFVSLILGLYSTAYLGTLEAHYFKKDNFVFNTDKPTMFTAIEENVVVDLKAKILQSKN